MSHYPNHVINWAIQSDLDRVDQHRASAEWVAGLWHAEDAKLLTLDAESRFSTNAGGTEALATACSFSISPTRFAFFVTVTVTS